MGFRFIFQAFFLKLSTRKATISSLHDGWETSRWTRWSTWSSARLTSTATSLPTKGTSGTTSSSRCHTGLSGPVTHFFDSVPFASLCDNELFICRWMSCTWKAATGPQTQPFVISPPWCWRGRRRRRRRSGSSTGAGWTLRWSGSLTQCESTQIFTTHQC